MHRSGCMCPRCINGRRNRIIIGVSATLTIVAAAGIGYLYYSGNLNIFSLAEAGINNIDLPTIPESPILLPTEEQIEDARQERREIIENPDADTQTNDGPPSQVTTTRPSTQTEQEASSTTSEPMLAELREYALQRINEDRADFGLLPVELSDNQDAQVHAEDVYQTMYISHWMTNGEKPYMTYTRYGGLGDVGQNVATSGDQDYYEDCTSGFYLCQTIEPYSAIDEHQYGMVYDDLVCCDNGHRDNILDPHHTHVSIGIAYNDYFFVMVQNFENNYIDFIAPITEDGENIQITGYLPNDMELSTISIYYDELPTAQTYAQNKARRSYDSGELIAGVTEPGYYFEGIETIEASNWHESNNLVDIRFSLESITDEPGVYTLVTWLMNDDGEDVPATSYSVFVG